jgi:hypothetical protein
MAEHQSTDCPTPRKEAPHPTKPARYLINHPSEPMPLDVRAWQMWAVHPGDLVEMGFATREEFFLAHLQEAARAR